VNFAEEIQRHLVVFDCNIYLDAAHLLSQPFSWPKFDAAAARLARLPMPHPTDGANDSLRALAACTSGRFAGEEALEVWTSSHIDKIVRGKAQHPNTNDPSFEHRGLGWSRADADALVDDLIYGLVERSGGGSVGQLVPDGNPPLDHEDGMVFGACRYLAGDDPLAHVYCVTRDRGFLDAYKARSLSNHSRVMTPATFIALTRAARTQYSIRRLGKRP
jgi:hypothetical protein